MASTPLHFAIGASVGMTLLAPRLRQAWQTRVGLTAATRTWLLTSWACGVGASLPSLLKYVGVSESITTGFWMNIFFLHPLLNAFVSQNYLLGGTALGLTAAIQYGWILLAIIRCRRQ